MSGCYDSESKLYRWAEVTDGAWEHYQKNSDPKAYVDALMESKSSLTSFAFLSVLFPEVETVYIGSSMCEARLV